MGGLLLIKNFVSGRSSPFLNVWFGLCGAKSGEKEAIPNGRAVTERGAREGGLSDFCRNLGQTESRSHLPTGITRLVWQTQITNTSKSQTEISVQNCAVPCQLKRLGILFE